MAHRNGVTRIAKTRSVVVFMLALLAAASMWFYMNRILEPQQVTDAAAHDRPRGSLSDLYPRWLGARELLLHRRNPYSQEITQEIQRGYYGRPLDPSRPDDPRDEQRFAYPVYVVFLLAPTIALPFDVVEAGFRWLLVGIAVVSVLLWFRVLRWKVSITSTVLSIVLVLGSLPVVQAIKLEQLSLLVAGMLAGSAACLAYGYLFSAGVLLALATIKPQLSWPIVIWLLLWAGSDWHLRRRLVLGFGFAMTLFLVGAEFVLPGWGHMFRQALTQYHQYTQNQSILQWLVGPGWGWFLEALAVLLCAVCLWRLRREPASSPRFGRAFGLVLALTVVIVPMHSPYNQCLLLPAILTLVERATARRSVSPAARLAGLLGGLLVVWPWIATLSLSVAYWWPSSGGRQTVWTPPFYTIFAIPVAVFSLTCLAAWSAEAPDYKDTLAESSAAATG